MSALAETPRLRGPLGASALLHAAIVGAFIAFQGEGPPAQPPIYRVTLVAAPAGPRAAGVVTPSPPARPPEPDATPPPRSQTSPRDMPAPTTRPPQRTPVPATPSPAPIRQAQPQTPPQAGGGAVGGRGTDVANVRTDGIDFQFPGYLANIVRQIALRFKPGNTSEALRAEARFLIRRDGTVAGVRITVPSPDYAFNLEAQGAIESAGEQKAFGALPAGYPDDVLPVVFSFDPRLIRPD